MPCILAVIMFDMFEIQNFVIKLSMWWLALALTTHKLDRRSIMHHEDRQQVVRGWRLCGVQDFIIILRSYRLFCEPFYICQWGLKNGCGRNLATITDDITDLGQPGLPGHGMDARDSSLPQEPKLLVLVHHAVHIVIHHGYCGISHSGGWLWASQPLLTSSALALLLQICSDLISSWS